MLRARVCGTSTHRIFLPEGATQTVNHETQAEITPERAVVTITDPLGTISDTFQFTHPLEIAACARIIKAMLFTVEVPAPPA